MMDVYRDDGNCVVCEKHEACRWCRRTRTDEHPIRMCLECYEKYKLKPKPKPEKTNILVLTHPQPLALDTPEDNEVCVGPETEKRKKEYNGTRITGSRRKTIVYCIGETSTDMVKIGKSHCESCISTRMGALQIGNPRKLVLHAIWRKWTEEEIHKKFSKSHVRGEWFLRTPEMGLFMMEGPVPVVWTKRKHKEHSIEAMA